MQTQIGVALATLSALSFALLSFFIKAYFNAIPTNIILLAQCFIGLLLIFPLIVKKYGVSALNIFTFSKIKKLHLIRAMFSMGISFFMFLSLKYMPFMDSVLIYNLNPFFVPFATLLVLKDKINHYLWPFILLGFIGVFLTLELSNNLFRLPILFALISALCVVCSVVMIRKILIIDNGIKSLYYFFIYATIIMFIFSVPTIIKGIHLININYELFVIVGILYFLTQITLIYSGKFIKPPIIACTYYTNIIFSLALSYLFLNGEITLKIIIGCLLIIVGGMGVIYVQNKNNK